MKTRDIWSTGGVHNAYMLVSAYRDETGHKGVYLGFASNDGSRLMMGSPHGVVVHRPGFSTDPGGHWTNHGDKLFNQFQYGNWDETFAAAGRWAAERYGLAGEFVGITGFGRDRFPIEIAEWAKAKFRTLKKEAA